MTKAKKFFMIFIPLVIVFSMLGIMLTACSSNGKSAYEIAVENGFRGTEQEWVESLVGKDGKDGKDGKSAYELAKENGYTGTEAEWLLTLVGAKGDDGKSAYELAKENGFDGTLQEWLASLIGAKGDKGDNGADGKSAYEVAVANGYNGTEEAWLESLKGTNGNNGKSAYELAQENGYEGTEAEWLLTLIGAKGDKGDNGADGKSAYEVAVANGYNGTEEAWLASLIGAKGDNGADGKSAYEVAVANGYNGTEEAWLESLVGQTGADGKSAYQLAQENGFEGTVDEWLESLKGDKGDQGQQGEQGDDGVGIATINTSIEVDGSIQYLVMEYTLTDGRVIRNVVVLPLKNSTTTSEKVNVKTETIDNVDVTIVDVEYATEEPNKYVELETKSKDETATYTAQVPNGVILLDGASTLTLAVEPVDDGAITIEDGSLTTAFDITIPEVSEHNNTVITVVLPYEAGLNAEDIELLHGDVAMTRVANLEDLANNTFYYDATTGNLTLGVTNFSEFTVKVNNYYVTTVAELVSAIEKGSNVIRLGADLAYNGTVTFTKDTTIELNGHTLQSQNNSAICAKDGATVTINGEGNVKAQEVCVLVYGGSKAIINGGTYTSIDNFVVGTNGTDGWGNNTITINGGTFNGGITSAGYAACGIYVANSDTVVVNGGTFNITNGVGILARSGNTTVNAGVTFNVTGDGTTGKVGDSKVTVPAGAVLVLDLAAGYPGGVPTLENNGGFEVYTVINELSELVDAMSNGGNYVLAADFTYNGMVAFSKDATILLNGHTIKSNNDSALGATEGAKLTINGNGNVQAQEVCVLVLDGSEAVINGGTYTSIDNFVFGTNGTSGRGNNTITINGGTFNGGITSAGYVACGIYVANNDTVVVNGGTFNITNGVGILARSGNTTVNAGVTFNVTGDGTTGKVGDSRVVVPSGSELVIDLAAGYPGGEPTLVNNSSYEVSKVVKATSEAELNAAIADAKVIVLGADIDLADDTNIVIEGKQLTLDLNGHTIKGNHNKTYNVANKLGAVLMLMNGANVTVTDNSTGATRGTIENLATGTNPRYAICSVESDLVLDGGVNIAINTTGSTVDKSIAVRAFGSYHLVVKDANFRTKVVAIRDNNTTGSATLNGDGYITIEKATSTGTYLIAGRTDADEIAEYYHIENATSAKISVAELNALNGSYVLISDDEVTISKEAPTKYNAHVTFANYKNAEVYVDGDISRLAEVLGSTPLYGTTIDIVDDTVGTPTTAFGSTKGSASDYVITFNIASGKTLSGSVKTNIVKFAFDGEGSHDLTLVPNNTATSQKYAISADGNSCELKSDAVEAIVEEDNALYLSLATALKTGKQVKLNKDVVLTERLYLFSNKVEGQTYSLDLNGHKLTMDESKYNAGSNNAVIYVGKNATLTIQDSVGDGSIDGENKFYGVDVLNGGVLNVESGIIKGAVSAIQVEVGTANISGGEFSSTTEDYTYTINCIDANYQAGTAVINVTGGTFYKFNPADNAAESAGTNFVANGYVSTQNGDYYVVTKAE